MGNTPILSEEILSSDPSSLEATSFPKRAEDPLFSMDEIKSSLKNPWLPKLISAHQRGTLGEIEMKINTNIPNDFLNQWKQFRDAKKFLESLGVRFPIQTKPTRGGSGSKA